MGVRRILLASLMGIAVVAVAPAWSAPPGKSRFMPYVTSKVHAPVSVTWESRGGQLVGESFETTIEIVPKVDYQQLVVKAGADGGVAIVNQGAIVERGAGEADQPVVFSVRGERVDSSSGRVHLTLTLVLDGMTTGRSVVVEFGGEARKATARSPGRLDGEAGLRILPAAENDRSDRPVPN